MALFDAPPHTCTILGPPTITRDDGGGTVVTHSTTRQADVPCSINLSSSSERELFAQQGITVTHRIGVRTSTLSSAVARGDKVTVGGLSYLIRGISAGQAYGGIPALTYLDVEQQL